MAIPFGVTHQAFTGFFSITGFKASHPRKFADQLIDIPQLMKDPAINITNRN